MDTPMLPVGNLQDQTCSTSILHAAGYSSAIVHVYSNFKCLKD